METSRCPLRTISPSAGTPLSASLDGSPSPSRSGRPTRPAAPPIHRGPVRGRDALAPSRRGLSLGAPRPPAPRGSPPRPPQARPRRPSGGAAAAAASAAGPVAGPAPAAALIGWPGPAAALKLGRADSQLGQGCRGAWRTGGSGAAARARQDAGRPPASPSERPGAPRGPRAPPSAAALAAMCSRLWFLTDRHPRGLPAGADPARPPAALLRAGRALRAVLMDQIAVTIVGGNLGELGGPGRGGGGAPGSPRTSGWARSSEPPHGRVSFGSPKPAALPERPLPGLEKFPNLGSFLTQHALRARFEAGFNSLRRLSLEGT